MSFNNVLPLRVKIKEFKWQTQISSFSCITSMNLSSYLPSVRHKFNFAPGHLPCYLAYSQHLLVDSTIAANLFLAPAFLERGLQLFRGSFLLQIKGKSYQV